MEELINNLFNYSFTLNIYFSTSFLSAFEIVLNLNCGGILGVLNKVQNIDADGDIEILIL